jgi:hypothetical protein
MPLRVAFAEGSPASCDVELTQQGQPQDDSTHARPIASCNGGRIPCCKALFKPIDRRPITGVPTYGQRT